MSKTRKLRERPVRPKALACGTLEDAGRVLFLIQKDRQGVERLELPSANVYPGDDPAALLKQAFIEQVGLDVEVCEIVQEARFNAGSRKRKGFVPCLVFKVRAKNRQVNVSGEFSGTLWISFENAKERKLGRKAEWIKRLK